MAPPENQHAGSFDMYRPDIEAMLSKAGARTQVGLVEDQDWLDWAAEYGDNLIETFPVSINHIGQDDTGGFQSVVGNSTLPDAKRKVKLIASIYGGNQASADQAVVVACAPNGSNRVPLTSDWLQDWPQKVISPCGGACCEFLPHGTAWHFRVHQAVNSGPAGLLRALGPIAIFVASLLAERGWSPMVAAICFGIAPDSPDGIFAWVD